MNQTPELKIPKFLPELPKLPEGAVRWEYMGRGYETEVRQYLATCSQDPVEPAWVVHASRARGVVSMHYLRAVFPPQDRATGLEALKEVLNGGLGTQRTAGALVAALLLLEENRRSVGFILLDVLQQLNIELESLKKLQAWDAAGGYTQKGISGDVEPPQI